MPVSKYSPPSHIQGRKPGMYALTRLYARTMLPIMRGILLFLRRILRYWPSKFRRLPNPTR